MGLDLLGSIRNNERLFQRELLRNDAPHIMVAALLYCTHPEYRTPGSLRSRSRREPATTSAPLFDS